MTPSDPHYQTLSWFWQQRAQITLIQIRKMEKREATWFLIYSNLQTGVCVKRLQKARALRSAFGRVATLEMLPYFLCALARTQARTHTQLKCSLHSCQWLYNSWCVSVKSVHCPVCAQSMKSPVTCNNLLPGLFIVPLLEMHFRVTTLIYQQKGCMIWWKGW